MPTTSTAIASRARPPHAVPAGGLRLIHLPQPYPEDVILDREGRILCGVEGGSIVRVNPDGSDACVVANTGGRPLGLDWLPDGRLAVCDSDRGLLAVDVNSGAVELLVHSVQGKAMLVCNNPCVARDGTIYFSDSSQRRPLSGIRAEIIEHIPTGRLLRRDPDGAVHVLLNDLQFANGVVLASDETFVLVAETGAARIQRLWLKGPKSGTCEIFADSLPGLPDNMSLGEDGLYWVGLPSAADKRLLAIHRLPTAARRIVASIPENLIPQDPRCVLAMAFDEAGTCVRYMEGHALRYHLVTGVRQRGDTLYASSIEESAIAAIPIPRAKS